MRTVDRSSPATAEHSGAVEVPLFLSLETCRAAELAAWLQTRRFRNQDTDEVSQCQTKDSLTATQEFLAQALDSLRGTDVDTGSDPVGYSVSPEGSLERSVGRSHHKQQVSLLKDDNITVSFTTPRAKFVVTVCENGLLARHDKQGTLHIPSGAVTHIVFFPKPEDCARSSTSKSQTTTKNTFDMCLLLLEPNAVQFHKKNPSKNNNKTMNQVCFQLPETLPVYRKNTSNTENPLQAPRPLDPTSQWSNVLCTALGVDSSRSVARVWHPSSPPPPYCSTPRNPFIFASHQDATTSSTVDGMPFVKCYHGVHDGVLYPLREGLLFFKPPCFVPRQKLASIACGRGGDTSSRYVDLTLTTTQDNETFEFTNIHRDELATINSYIHETLIPAMQRDVLKDSDIEDASFKGTVLTRTELKQDNEEYTVLERSYCRPKRKASVEARAINRKVQKSQLENDDEDDDDDDDEFVNRDQTMVQDDDEEFSSDEREGKSSDDEETSNDEEAVVETEDHEDETESDEDC
ncbi:predicted protein [Phaeodactylum tricornutum CCAP 1055/1]|jgi:hypothetical protein|uniref:Histone chaperone RTT106/FACT complex subunit SPT16-like middle domain-containing protein n=1 Tax=Phaeodactylum tricornutum (strain CCAP 1055/1) TaxID=556484 RepID=B7FW81_PHATC|nr:predicted protein [Phaeodactylum tricornutum CCAP 1055/1]EEC49755.1 predicted protein [Phaeodactylum tricornutum CCAP 1055/1]|eukprot:XP_002179057.1 predicted protein [Phaeodactylum tricornutum CCAP 1055/1]